MQVGIDVSVSDEANKKKAPVHGAFLFSMLS